MSAKVTPDEQHLLEILARQAGITASEYFRSVLLERFRPQAVDRLLLAELCNTQTILLSLMDAAVKGVSLTNEQIRDLVQRAEDTKFFKADSKLAPLFTALQMKQSPEVTLGQ